MRPWIWAAALMLGLAASQSAFAADAKVLKIEPAAQQRLGVTTAPLTTTQRAATVNGFARAIDAAPLAALDSDIAAAAAALSASQVQATRTRTLNQADQTVSKQVAEAAAAQARTDAAKLTLLRRRLGLEWGPSIQALTDARRGRLVADIAAGRAALIRIDASGGLAQLKGVATIDLGAAGSARATILGPARVGDARLQSTGLLALITGPQAMRMASGTLAAATLAVGAASTGVVIPRSALLRTGGETFAYVRRDAGSFERRPVVDGAVDPQGLVVTGGFRPGEQVVVKGAAQLFAAEIAGKGGVNMLSAIVGWTLQRPRLVIAAALMLLIYGGVVLSRAKLDVFPDFVPAQAEVQTEAPGLTAEQVEKLVTRPVEQSINGAAGVASVRSESQAGISVVKVVFSEGSDPYRARQVVAEALSEIGGLPAGVGAPKVSPLTSSTMDLLKIGFTSDKLSPMALRDLVQWTIRPRILSAAGVARATVYGGQVRRLEVRVRPEALAARDLGLADVLAAVKASTGVSGGGYIDTPQQRILIEPRGQASSAADIAAAPLPSVAGAAPARIGDIAEVVDGAGPLNGDAVIMGRPGVLLSISSQYGANTLDATHAVEAAMAELAPSLKTQGVTANMGLHRPANFIGSALKGIADDLAIGAVLIALVLFLFMRDVRTVAIAFVSIPLALLTAVIVLDRMGSTINTMTLGGLAVALGVVVDDAVIGTENIVRRLRVAGREASPADVILAASVEVRAPVVYATLMLALVLLPVLLLHGLQGAFFSPLAASFIIATLASLAVAVVVTPPLSLLLLKNARLPEEPRLLLGAKNLHQRLLGRAIAAPAWAVGASAVALAATVAGFLLFNSELLPNFREGHFVLAVQGPPGTSLAVMRDYGQRITKDLLAIDGIADTEQQIGRAEGGEDTWGTEKSEFHVELKPGLSGRKQDQIQKSIHEVLDGYPGLTTEVLTFLGDRIGESLSGETAALAVGVYGADLDTLDKVAAEIAAVLEKVPGAVDVTVQTPPSTPVVRVDLDFPALARYGVSPAEALEAVQTAYQGETVAQIFQDIRSVDIAVTTPPDLRRDPESVGELLIRSAGGIAVPLKSIAKVSLTDGRTSVSHDGGRPRQVVTANPAPKDAGRVAKAAEAAIAAKVKLPPGVYLDYTGTAQGAAAARKELLFNTVIAAAGVIALLLLAFGSGRATGLILVATPFALVGGVIAVAATGASLSLGSLVGFVTLFGVAARNSILLIAHVEHLIEQEGHDWSVDTLLLATRERVTPILMTALVTGLGVLPLAISTGQAGREIQGPMAIVILGGLVTSTIASLVLLPALTWRYGRAPQRPAPQT